MGEMVAVLKQIIISFDPPPLTLCVSLQCDFVGRFIEIIGVFIVKLLISILTTKSQ